MLVSMPESQNGVQAIFSSLFNKREAHGVREPFVQLVWCFVFGLDNIGHILKITNFIYIFLWWLQKILFL
jgi:hypothetical protein